MIPGIYPAAWHCLRYRLWRFTAARDQVAWCEWRSVSSSVLTSWDVFCRDCATLAQTAWKNGKANSFSNASSQVASGLAHIWFLLSRMTRIDKIPWNGGNFTCQAWLMQGQTFFLHDTDPCIRRSSEKSALQQCTNKKNQTHLDDIWLHYFFILLLWSPSGVPISKTVPLQGPNHSLLEIEAAFHFWPGLKLRSGTLSRDIPSVGSR